MDYEREHYIIAGKGLFRIFLTSAVAFTAWILIALFFWRDDAILLIITGIFLVFAISCWIMAALVGRTLCLLREKS